MKVLLVLPWSPELTSALRHALSVYSGEEVTLLRPKVRGLYAIEDLEAGEYDVAICQIAPSELYGANEWLRKLNELPAETKSRIAVFCLVRPPIDAMSMGFRRCLFLRPEQFDSDFVERCLAQ